MRNLNLPTNYGIGYIGTKKYQTHYLPKTHHTLFTLWKKMYERCYGKRQSVDNKTYLGCSVSPLWHNFQDFCNWHSTQWTPSGSPELDKDAILIGNKVYSPDTCIMLPRAINALFRTYKSRSLPVGVHQSTNNYRVYSPTGSYLGSFPTLLESEVTQLKSQLAHTRRTLQSHYNNEVGRGAPESYLSKFRELGQARVKAIRDKLEVLEAE